MKKLDRSNYKKLKSTDTSKLARTLSDILAMLPDSYNRHSMASFLAFDALQKKDNSFAEKLSTTDISESTLSSAEDNISKCKDSALENLLSFSETELKAFILFDNSLEILKSGPVSTPSSVLALADPLLGITPQDDVLEYCSGKGNFVVECLTMNPPASYMGLELNYTEMDLAILRAYVSGLDVKYILTDALEYSCNKKYHKIFANYPFMARTPAMNGYKENLCKALDIPEPVLKRASSDWVFNTSIMTHLHPEGKAVVIMTSGSVWNIPDKKIRQFFIDNGYIEAVISLPERLFPNTGISTTMAVLSHNNTNIRMVDARKIFTQNRRINVLSAENIQEILSLLDHDEDNSTLQPLSAFAENDYSLDPVRYLTTAPSFEDGVIFDDIITEITRGAQIKADEMDALKTAVPTQMQYLTLSNIQDGIIDIENEQYLSEIPKNLEKYIIENDSLILSKIGTPSFKCAAAEIPDKRKIIATGNFHIIEIDKTKANPYYIQAFFQSETGQAVLKKNASGTTMPTISVRSLKELVIPLPSLEKQNEIAAKYTSATDQIILLRRKLEKITDTLKHICNEEE